MGTGRAEPMLLLHPENVGKVASQVLPLQHSDNEPFWEIRNSLPMGEFLTRV